jgi:signal transduction histidine kinase
LATGDSLAALRAFLDLYEGLVEGEWTLERAQYDLFSSPADSIAQQLTQLAAHDSSEVYRQRLADLRAREDGLREKTDRLLLLQETAAEDLRARFGVGTRQGAPNGSRIALTSGGQTYLVSLLDQVGDSNRVWGVLYDADALGGFLRGTLNDHLDPATTDWIVKGRDGQTLLLRDQPPTGPLTINATFADNFPPWWIEFYQQPENPYRRLFASSQSLYFYMFLLIAGILGFGLVLTVRAVSHELELARLKSDFVSTVSHEFKSPLTSISHLAEMLQAGSIPSEERRQRYYDVLVEQSARLSSLVTNILDLARIEEGKKEFAFETLDMGELVRDLVTTTQQRVGHDGYAIDAHIEESLPSVRADRSAIAQAVTNLLDNAIQYSQDAKQIVVAVSATEEHVIVAVEDHGVGIPANEIDKVFDRFYRGGDAHTRAVKGSGLGLTLVKEIVEAHGGTVQVGSEVGQGSTFSIQLPAVTE